MARYDSQLSDLRRNLESMEVENDKLRATMREMVDDYTRQLELRDETIKRMESGLGQAPAQPSGVDLQLRQELDHFREENGILRDKVSQLSRQVEMGA